MLVNTTDNNEQIIEIEYNKKIFRIGDNVIYNHNDNEVNLTNGLLGKIVDISSHFILVDHIIMKFPYYFRYPRKKSDIYEIDQDILLDDNKIKKINKVNFIKTKE
jgi:hypothetical protein